MFVSSHLLAEVQVMVDVVGIIAAGRLVREDTIDRLLQTQGVVRVRVAPDEVDRALAALAGFGVATDMQEVQAGHINVRTRARPRG